MTPNRLPRPITGIATATAMATLVFAGAAYATDAGQGASSPPSTGTDTTIVLRADRILDGRGAVLTGREVVVRDGRIEAVAEAGATGGAVVYDLPGATLLPGLIDTHVHIGWYFDEDTGRLRGPESTDTA